MFNSIFVNSGYQVYFLDHSSSLRSKLRHALLFDHTKIDIQSRAKVYIRVVLRSWLDSLPFKIYKDFQIRYYPCSSKGCKAARDQRLIFEKNCLSNHIWDIFTSFFRKSAQSLNGRIHVQKHSSSFKVFNLSSIIMFMLI